MCVGWGGVLSSPCFIATDASQQLDCELLAAGIRWTSEWRGLQLLINSLIFPQSANEVIKIKLMRKEGDSQQQLGGFYLRQSSLCAGAPGARRDLKTDFECVYFVFHIECNFQKCFLICKCVTLSILPPDSDPDPVKHLSK